MRTLNYRDAVLHMEHVNLAELAKEFGTPCYVYSQQEIENNWHAFDYAFDRIPHSTCYAVKANSNIAILNLFAKLNSGFDIVSMGELERVLAAHGDPRKIFFSGVGKTTKEIERAIKANIHCFNVESHSELERLNAIAAQHQLKINIALRINPDITTKTHRHIVTGSKENKFGIAIDEAMSICQNLSHFPALNLIGLACHIGSQILSIDPFLKAIKKLLKINMHLQSMNVTLQHLNIGGGLGIVYQNENPPSIDDYAKAIQKEIGDLPLKLIIEPGRAMVGNAGILLTRVEYLKTTPSKNFAIVDAGMNDLLRPALYNAWQNILPVKEHAEDKKFFDVMGPLCESADFIGKDRQMAIRPGDLLAVCSAGAYGFSMSSNYNSRCRPAEVLITKNEARLIRRRETVEDLWRLERV